MTTVEITLPDQLARDAERAGLFSSEVIEESLRKQLRARASAELFVAIETISSENNLPYMSAEEVAQEIKEMRAERRALKDGQ